MMQLSKSDYLKYLICPSYLVAMEEQTLRLCQLMKMKLSNSALSKVTRLSATLDFCSPKLSSLSRMEQPAKADTEKLVASGAKTISSRLL
jgi:hypothetical protein